MYRGTVSSLLDENVQCSIYKWHRQPGEFFCCLISDTFMIVRYLKAPLVPFSKFDHDIVIHQYISE